MTRLLQYLYPGFTLRAQACKLAAWALVLALSPLLARAPRHWAGWLLTGIVVTCSAMGATLDACRRVLAVTEEGKK